MKTFNQLLVTPIIISTDNYCEEAAKLSAGVTCDKPLTTRFDCFAHYLLNYKQVL